jgi:hypothetical protein
VPVSEADIQPASQLNDPIRLITANPVAPGNLHRAGNAGNEGWHFNLSVTPASLTGQDA